MLKCIFVGTTWSEIKVSSNKLYELVTRVKCCIVLNSHWIRWNYCYKFFIYFFYLENSCYSYLRHFFQTVPPVETSYLLCMLSQKSKIMVVFKWLATASGCWLWQAGLVPTASDSWGKVIDRLSLFLLPSPPHPTPRASHHTVNLLTKRLHSRHLTEAIVFPSLDYFALGKIHLVFCEKSVLKTTKGRQTLN